MLLMQSNYMKYKLIIFSLSLMAATLLTNKAQAQTDRDDSANTVVRDEAKVQETNDENRMANAKADRKSTKEKAKNAKRIERDANNAAKEARYAHKSEKKAQKSRRHANDQAEKATKARNKSDSN
jgi:hypothetical protein